MRRSIKSETVKEIVKLYRDGWGCRSIFRITGVPETIVRQILRGKNYKHITGGRVMKGRRPNRSLEYYK